MNRIILIINFKKFRKRPCCRERKRKLRNSNTKHICGVRRLLC